MATYSTSLKTWGASGEEYPNSYNYVEGEQPVDDWDNFFNSNTVSDIEHLIDITNNRLGTDDGTEASAGGLRLQNAEWLAARNNADGADVNVWQVNTSDEIEAGALVNLADDLVAKDGEVIWDESAGEIPDAVMGSIDNATLTNSSVTVAGNTVALGASTAVSVDDLSDVASTTETAGQLPVWNATNDQYENAALTGGNALSVTNADASITIDIDAGGIQTDELDLSITPTWTGQHQFSAGLDSRGDIVDNATVIWDTSAGEIPDAAMGSIDNATLTNSSVTVAGNSVSLGGSTAVSVDDLNDVASTTESAGQLPVWNATNNQYENAALTGGNAISVTNADASVTLAVPTDTIKADELDLSIAPTWTGNHTFNSVVDANQFDINGNTIADSVVASGAVSLSSGVATVSTGVVSTTSGNADATFYVAMGTDTDDAKVSARIYEDSADDTYKVEFVESGTSVGTVSVDYDIIRVR